MSSLIVVPVTRKHARAFVARHHSHHWPPNTWILAVGVRAGTVLVCCAILELPKARLLCRDGLTAEVSRVASDGTTENAVSKALGAITRAALAIGYRRLVSYLLLGERGSSYRAANWWPTALVQGRSWNKPSRPRTGRDSAQVGAKVRWEYGPGAMPPSAEIAALVRASAGTIEIPPRRSFEPLFERGRAL